MRNYKNEIEWRKKKYIEIRAYINKETATKLKLKLKSQNRTVANWLEENAKNYLNL